VPSEVRGAEAAFRQVGKVIENVAFSFGSGTTGELRERRFQCLIEVDVSSAHAKVANTAARLLPSDASIGEVTAREGAAAPTRVGGKLW
jgi:hypothetical protein